MPSQEKIISQWLNIYPHLFTVAGAA